MGESFGQYHLGDDAAMLDIITSANIACGLHAGGPLVMRETVTNAARRGVAIGAHPAYPDLQGFGRRAMQLSSAELEAFLIYQLGALAGFAQTAGTRLEHVKPHGALYNQAVSDPDIAAAIARAVAVFDPTLIVVTLPESALRLAALGIGLRVALEGFADRAYLNNGTLAPRSLRGAVIHDPGVAAARAIRMVVQGEVETLEGTVIPLRVNTICVHGDTPGATQIAAHLREVLEKAQITLAPLNEVLKG
ncbi:MAG: 5-oxoprolinase subunit PxpA [Anaerolineae bacterium]|nr:5-oxoprolinase subunit PxpA [Anaerolineae bacterium]